MNRMLLLAFTLLPVAAVAQTKLDIVTAQVQMSLRVSAVAQQQAQKLGLSEDAVTYCRVKLNYKESTFPQDGQIPFGVNYNKFTDPKELAQVIAAREGYEKTYMRLCLARVKQQIAAAK